MFQMFLEDGVDRLLLCLSLNVPQGPVLASTFKQVNQKKNTSDGFMVLKQMELADVKPDSITFSYLISNCECEEDIIKKWLPENQLLFLNTMYTMPGMEENFRYYKELNHSGVQATKHVFMALINAYAAHGQFEKAKQVISDEGIPVKNLNEVRCVLVSALASNGQTADALKIYDEMKQAGCDLDCKAVSSLIEHYPFDGPLNRMLQLLGDLHHDLNGWIHCCSRIILFSVKHNDLSSTVDLLKQLSYRCTNDETIMGVTFDEVFCLIANSEPTYLEIGLQLLKFIKNDLGLSPPRRCLDFLLGTCANAKDAESSRLIWKEYENAGLLYNTISYLKMYQALLASGDSKSAKLLLGKIPKDDADVCYIIKECERVYSSTAKKKKVLKMSRNNVEIDGSLADLDGHLESGSKKRFLELGSILDPGRPPKTDKAAILVDAVRMAEKNELRDEKQRLKADKRLEQQVKSMPAQQPGFLPPPIPTFPAQGQAPGNKLFPFIGYHRVLPCGIHAPAAVDTSQDHVLRPPVPNLVATKVAKRKPLAGPILGISPNNPNLHFYCAIVNNIY
ncbi:hypothetical protein CSA_021116 [Cucumis sativus]|uniref:Uncharacterized protein n=1 Tax=Cucumis sativus TaxID=3659 RepID=A0ACB6HBE3_CUCSA|nr:hypothetical protein CSA_021116 [Cucumis sativus]